MKLFELVTLSAFGTGFENFAKFSPRRESRNYKKNYVNITVFHKNEF